MGALTVRFPESLHERVRGLAEQEGISMNQFAVLAVSEKVARLDTEAQYAHLDALERIGEELAAEQGQSLAEAARAVLDKAAESQAAKSQTAESQADGSRTLAEDGSAPGRP